MLTSAEGTSPFATALSIPTLPLSHRWLSIISLLNLSDSGGISWWF